LKQSNGTECASLLNPLVEGIPRRNNQRRRRRDSVRASWPSVPNPENGRWLRICFPRCSM
jgi:hypothetical protein